MAREKRKHIRTERIDELRVRVPRHGGMAVEGRLFATEEMMVKVLEDNALSQVSNVAHLPGIVDWSLAMPDIHWGYGFPIGGVAAFGLEEGVISPGGVGYDINCGVRLVRTHLHKSDVVPRQKELVRQLFKEIPAGLGSKRKASKVNQKELRALLLRGAAWAVDQGAGSPADLERIEDKGCLAGADPDALSPRALERGAPQVGTLGSGNHFVEVGWVDEILDKPTAQAFGLEPEQIVVMIHTGSRGLGHQVCDDSIRIMLKASEKYGIRLPDRQLCAAPLSSGEGRRYLAAMSAAANFAFANRQMLSARVGRVMRSVFGDEGRISLLYDVCHNIAKIEEHETSGGLRKVCVHRKGATRAFPAGHPDLAGPYQAWGQPVLIPGDMGRSSFVLAGEPGSMRETFGSCCHGAGREMSRHKAKKAARGRDLGKELLRAGVQVMATGRQTLAEEMPAAYKDVDQVVDVVHKAGIARKVVRLRPLCVVKG